MAVFLFYGQEEYFIDKEIKKLRSGLLNEAFAAMSYKVFDNPPYGVLMECLQAAPLMFGNTLSVISVNKYLIGKDLTFDDNQIESIDYALAHLNNAVNIVFICKIARDENKKPDSRKKFYKTLSKYSQVREFPQLKTYQEELKIQISKMAKEKGLTINSVNTELFIEQLGVNLTLIDSELEKLKIAVYPKKNIDRNDIKNYCSSSEDIFMLADLIVKGSKNEVLRQYNLLTEKRHPLEIFSILQKNFHQFIFIKNYEKKMSEKDIALQLKIPGKGEFIVKKIREKLSGATLEKLVQIKENLVYAEYKLKTGRCTSGETLLELALLS